MKWTSQEVETLKNPNLTYVELGFLLGRSPEAVKMKVRSLGLPHLRGVWTDEEDAYLREHLTDSDSQIGLALGKTKSAVCYRRHVLGLTRVKPPKVCKVIELRPKRKVPPRLRSAFVKFVVETAKRLKAAS